MTIEDIKKMDKEVLTPGDIAPVLRCDPNVIREQARVDVKQLGFPAAKIGTRVKIPRLAFISWFEGQKENDKIRQETLHLTTETFTLKTGNNAPDPRALLAKHNEQRKHAEREARSSLVIKKTTDKEK